LVDISEDALLKRAENRKKLPQHPLEFTRSGSLTRVEKQLKLDFIWLVKKFPHHENLINQLLGGVSLSTANVSSYGSIKKYYNAVEPFIVFLNSYNLSNNKVIYVCDIDTFVLQAYKYYLISSFPGVKTSNNRMYKNLCNSIKALTDKYSEDPLIAKGTLIPKGPQKKTNNTEGYNRYQIKKLIKCCLKDIKEIKKFHIEYNTLNSSSPQVSVSYNLGSAKHDPNLRFREILATIKDKWPDYPYNMSLENAKQLFGLRELGKPELLRRKIDVSLGRFVSKISFFKGYLGRGAVFAAQHFVSDTIYPFLLLAQIATGFNAECLMYMSDNLKEFICEDLLDPDNYVIIYGYKAKTDKLIPVRSKIKQANGAYQLLKYVHAVISKFKNSDNYLQGVLFQFTRMKLATKTDNEQLMCSFYGSPTRLHLMGKSFVERHSIEPLIGPSVCSGKIRSGFGTVALEGGFSTSQIAEQLGHSDAQKLPETADKYYLSDSASVAVKNKVIFSLQNQFVSDLTNYKCRIVTSKTLQQLRDSINSAKNEDERLTKIHEMAKELSLEEKAIVHLIDSGSQTYILACEDMTKPTWPGYERFVKNGQCRQHNKCCMCRQAVIFPEALPYIAKRIMDVEEFQNTMTAVEWVTNFADERDAWSNILKAWNNKAQLEDAWNAAKSGDILLPKVMRGGESLND